MAGASGFVLKQILGTDLVAAVRTVGRGGSLLDSRATEALMQRIRSDRTADPLAELSDQERAVFDLIGEGAHQPGDRRAIVPRGEDGQELRDASALEAGHAASYSGCGAGDRNP